MEALSISSTTPTRSVAAPVEVSAALRGIIAVDFAEFELPAHVIDGIVRTVDGEIEIDLEYAPGSRARFVEDRRGRAHVQYWTRGAGGMSLAGDCPVDLADAEAAARAIWQLVAQSVCGG